MTEEKQEFEKLFKEYQDYAKKNGICLNPDRKITESLIKGLIERERKYGERYCPCRRVTGNRKKDKKIICPCVYYKKEIEEQGYCHCFLFVSPTPEALAHKAEKDNFKNMNRFEVNKSKCAGCGACIKICPFGAIKIGEDGKAIIDKNKCQGCGKCKEICPFNAVETEKDK